MGWYLFPNMTEFTRKTEEEIKKLPVPEKLDYLIHKSFENDPWEKLFSDTTMKAKIIGGFFLFLLGLWGSIELLIQFVQFIRNMKL